MVKQAASLWRRSTQQKPIFQQGEIAMKYWVNTVLSLLVVMAMSPAQAQQDMPQLGAIESWGRQMNEGKSRSDLVEVVEDWNDSSD